MLLLRRLRPVRPAAIVTAGVAVGLFVSHLLSELVPDALAIGVCMFAAGALSGLLVGLSDRAAFRSIPTPPQENPDATRAASTPGQHPNPRL